MYFVLAVTFLRFLKWMYANQTYEVSVLLIHEVQCIVS